MNNRMHKKSQLEDISHEILDCFWAFLFCFPSCLFSSVLCYLLIFLFPVFSSSILPPSIFLSCFLYTYSLLTLSLLSPPLFSYLRSFLFSFLRFPFLPFIILCFVLLHSILSSLPFSCFPPYYVIFRLPLFSYFPLLFSFLFFCYIPLSSVLLLFSSLVYSSLQLPSVWRCDTTWREHLKCNHCSVHTSFGRRRWF